MPLDDANVVIERVRACDSGLFALITSDGLCVSRDCISGGTGEAEAGDVGAMVDAKGVAAVGAYEMADCGVVK